MDKDGGGVIVMVLKELARDCWSHSPVHEIQDGYTTGRVNNVCCGKAQGKGKGGRGGVGGPTCSTMAS
jgi:hypothetical protein